MPKAVIEFVFKLVRNGLRFRRFRVFGFSCFRAWRFRVFAFSRSAGGIPAAGTQISCAQLKRIQKELQYLKKYLKGLQWMDKSRCMHGG